MPFAAMWMDLEGIVLHEIIQRNSDALWYYSYVESSEYNKKETDSDIENKLVVTSGEMEGGQSRGRRLRDTNYYD